MVEGYRELEAELEQARTLDVDAIATAIEAIGFECTRCGACCKAHPPDATTDDTHTEDHPIQPPPEADATRGDAGCHSEPSGETAQDVEPHTSTVFPREIRRLQDAAEAAFDEAYDWRDVARPMPYGVTDDDDGPTGDTFEWALQTDSCGNCTFYETTDTEEGATQGVCTVHDSRPLVCQTYPFSLALGGTSQPLGDVVDETGLVQAHECEGLGQAIEPDKARALAATLKTRAIRELEEAIAVRDNYERQPDVDGVVVHDSEGAKRPDGTPIDGDSAPNSR